MGLKKNKITVFNTLKYMTEFRCLGGECPDSCCRDWTIYFDSETYHSLKPRLQDLPINDLDLEQIFSITNQADKNNHARLILNNDGSCPFLLNDGWCSIHCNLGSPFLCYNCKIYPRRYIFINNQILPEFCGYFSCPEIARLCLNTEDSTEIVTVGGKPHVLAHQGKSVYRHQSNEHPYIHFFDLVRGFFFRILSKAEMSLSTRLFICSCFAHQITPFFNKDTKEATEQRLSTEVDRINAPGNFGNLENILSQISPEPVLPLTILLSILANRLKGDVGINCFTKLLATVWQTYNHKDMSKEKLENIFLDNTVLLGYANKILETYLHRKNILINICAQHWDKCITNYCKNYWFGEPYIKSNNTFIHNQDLLLRVALFNFLYFSHPELDILMDDGLHSSPSSTQRIMNKVAIEILYSVSRGIEHDPVFSLDITNTFTSGNLYNLKFSSLLIKF